MLAAGGNPQDLHSPEEWINCYASNARNPLCLFSDPVALQEDGGTHIRKNLSFQPEVPFVLALENIKPLCAVTISLDKFCLN